VSYAAISFAAIVEVEFSDPFDELVTWILADLAQLLEAT
jgi:hypothetical protein